MNRRTSNRATGIAAAMLILLPQGTGAREVEDSLFSFGGFGTLGVVHSTEHAADFNSSTFQANGAGYSHDWAANVDSLIGAQVTANFTPHLTAVLQVVAEQNYDGSFRPHVEWANVAYAVTPEFSVRIGRTVLPAFLLSENRKVGYTFPWVRPTVDVYRSLPATYSDGLDVTYSLRLGESVTQLQANAGRKDSQLPNNNGIAHARRSRGLAITTDYGALTVRAAFQKTNLTIASINALFDAFRQFGPQGMALADKYFSAGKPLVTYALGVSYDPGRWLVMSEWGDTKSSSALGEQIGWYVGGGYRIGPFTPFVTYAQARADNLSDPGLTLAQLPPDLQGPAAGLNGALNSILRQKAVQNTVAVGCRWDFIKNFDLKMQMNHTRIGAGSTGVLTNAQPDFQTGGTFNLFTATVDFVF